MKPGEEGISQCSSHSLRVMVQGRRLQITNEGISSKYEKEERILKRDKIAKNKKQKSKTGRERERIEREQRREKQKLKSLVFPKSKQIKILKENYFHSSIPKPAYQLSMKLE